MLKKILKIAITLGLLVGLYYAFWLIYGTVLDWKPETQIPISVQGSATAQPDSTFEFMIWNIGFTGLGEETSFFFDDGEVVILDEDLVYKNLSGVKDFIKAHDVDFWMLQEVDSTARRSHGIDHTAEFHKLLPSYSSAFAMNFNHGHIPVPLLDSYGEVRSGLQNLSRFPVTNSKRIQYGTEYEWPTRIYYLDRCFLSQNVSLQNGKELVIINTHCSAYDALGTMVAQQIDELIAFAKAEYDRGNYVVIGGDWNQCPPNYSPIDTTGAYNEFVLSDAQLPAEWHWVADPTVPTNRKNDVPYTAGESYTSVIDHYIVSPNLIAEEVAVQDLQFQFSDHQPVYMKVRLK